MDYYRVLGVSPDADTTTIKRSYRKLAKEFHPDINKHDPNATLLFQRIVDAYDVLSDEDARAHYDRKMGVYSHGSSTSSKPTRQSSQPSRRAKYPSPFDTSARTEPTFVSSRVRTTHNDRSRSVSTGFLNFPYTYWGIIVALLGLAIIFFFVKIGYGFFALGVMVAFALIAAKWIDEARTYHPVGEQLPVREVLLIYVGSLVAAVVCVVFFTGGGSGRRYGRGGF